MVYEAFGVIQEIGFDGKLIVRGIFRPVPDRIVDNRNKPLGYIRRVFGPVDSPYIMVEPVDEATC